MSTGGLLWFDDDVRRSLQEKIADGAQRYRERLGFEPTVCELNPAQAAQLAAPAEGASARKSRSRAAKTPAPLPVTLRLIPNPHLRPYNFLIGIAAGDRQKRAHSPIREDTREAVAPRMATRTAPRGRKQPAHVAAPAPASEPTPASATQSRRHPRGKATPPVADAPARPARRRRA